MAANIHIADSLSNLRHVTAYAFTPGAVDLVMRVGLNRRRARAVGRLRAVTLQAEHIRRLEQIRVVRRPVRVVATETGYAVRVHLTRHEVIALHPVFVR